DHAVIVAPLRDLLGPEAGLWILQRERVRRAAVQDLVAFFVVGWIAALLEWRAPREETIVPQLHRPRNPVAVRILGAEEHEAHIAVRLAFVAVVVPHVADRDFDGPRRVADAHRAAPLPEAGVVVVRRVVIATRPDVAVGEKAEIDVVERHVAAIDELEVEGNEIVDERRFPAERRLLHPELERYVLWSIAPDVRIRVAVLAEEFLIRN